MTDSRTPKPQRPFSGPRGYDQETFSTSGCLVGIIQRGMSSPIFQSGGWVCITGTLFLWHSCQKCITWCEKTSSGPMAGLPVRATETWFCWQLLIFKEVELFKVLQLWASGPFCLRRQMWSQGPQTELNIWLPLSLKVCSIMSGHDQDEFQAMGAGVC